MKKNVFIYFLICLCFLFLTACPIKVPDIARWEVKTRSFVLAFGEPTAFQMQLTDNNNIVLYWSNISQWFTFQSTGFEKVRYDQLTTQHNDLGYIRMTLAIEGGERFPTRRTYIFNNITSIDVISDTDFSTEYPAGTSLAGFVRLLSVSPMHFIESGYQETFDWHHNYPVDFLREATTIDSFVGDFFGAPTEYRMSKYPNHFPISEVLSELEPDDFRLLGIGTHFSKPSWQQGWRSHIGWFFGFLVFDKEPENLGTHRLTVTIHRTNRPVLRRTIEKTF